MFGTGKSGHGGDELMTPDEHLGFGSAGLTGDIRLDGGTKEGMNLGRLGGVSSGSIQ